MLLRQLGVFLDWGQVCREPLRFSLHCIDYRVLLVAHLVGTDVFLGLTQGALIGIVSFFQLLDSEAHLAHDLEFLAVAFASDVSVGSSHAVRVLSIPRHIRRPVLSIVARRHAARLLAHF